MRLVRSMRIQSGFSMCALALETIARSKPRSGGAHRQCKLALLELVLDGNKMMVTRGDARQRISSPITSIALSVRTICRHEDFPMKQERV